jgi:hypothetical protein
MELLNMSESDDHNHMHEIENLRHEDVHDQRAA